MIILWDVSEGQILFVGGDNDLQLKDRAVDSSSSEVDTNIPDDTSDHHLEEKEISALCWASSNGSILAVGYINGDILFWNTSCATSSKSQQVISSSNNIVKLQLSSAERRLPVIVLQWCKNQKSRNDCDGQLFIYGGDEIGSEEVLTVCYSSIAI
jgi:syntaxin-binding protein 5